MCNACGLMCCASDQLRECGCDACTIPGCWERCDLCGETIQWSGDCLCDEQYDEYPDNDREDDDV